MTIFELKDVFTTLAKDILILFKQGSKEEDIKILESHLLAYSVIINPIEVVSVKGLLNIYQSFNNDKIVRNFISTLYFKFRVHVDNDDLESLYNKLAYASTLQLDSDDITGINNELYRDMLKPDIIYEIVKNQPVIFIHLLLLVFMGVKDVV